MSILADKNTRVIIQGITGNEGGFHAEQMIEYGTRIVAGVTPGRGGQEKLGVPVFDTIDRALTEVEADASVIFVPPAMAADAIMEAAASLKLVICITEGIPALDMASVWHHLREHGVVLIGPNCPGLISPGQTKLGIMPGSIHSPGSVGVVSRSGTLTYEVVSQLTEAGLGESTCLGIGGDTIIGQSFVDILALFQEDSQTEAVVLVGEIGGRAEEDAAEYIQAEFTKPVFAFIAGQTAPPGRRMGHAGAIVSGKSGGAADKMATLKAAGIHVIEDLGIVGRTVKETLGR
ncbi:MAG: succinate--CoA ligase subunit alpha [Deltaproteobacteria bacterium]|nr:succinate--CoA ligase subunit alpha [Deltaproteobacteria bacterium]